MLSPIVVPVSYSEVLAFAKLHSAEVFHEPTAIGTEQLLAELDAEKIARLTHEEKARRYGFFLKFNDEIIGWHYARQEGSIIFHMEASGIRPAFQGRGYYKVLLAAVVDFARDEGYAAIISTHAANNNRIIVSKLRYGFFIKGFEINPMYGLDAKLVYYFNENQRKAHELRVGTRAWFDGGEASKLR